MTETALQPPGDTPLDAFAPLHVKRAQLEPFLADSSAAAAEVLHTIFVSLSEDLTFHPDGPAALAGIESAELAGDDAALDRATRHWSELTAEVVREADTIRDLCIAHARRMPEWGGIVILLGRAWEAIHADVESITDRAIATRVERERMAAIKGMARISREEFEAFADSQPATDRTGIVMQEFADTLRRMPERIPEKPVDLPPLGAADDRPGCAGALRQLALALIGRGPRMGGRG